LRRIIFPCLLLLFIMGFITTNISFSSSDSSWEVVFLNKADENPLNCAYLLAKKLGGDNSRVIFKQIAINFAKLGEFDLAYQIAKSKISFDDGQLNVLYELAEDYANVGLNEKAISILTEISHSFSLWTDAADIYYKLGQKDMALKILANDLKKAQDEPNDDIGSRDRTLIEVITSYTNMGEYNEANKIINNILSKSNRSEALGVIALSYANKKQFDKALKITLRIESSYAKVDILTKLAEKIIDDNQKGPANPLLDQAFQTAQNLDADYGKVLYLVNIASGYFLVGNKDKALEVLSMGLTVTKLIKNPNSKDSALREVSIAYGKVDEYEKAVEIMNTIKSESEKVYSFRGIWEADLKANKKEKAQVALNDALQIADNMKEDESRGTSGMFRDSNLEVVAIGYSEMGDFSQALQVVKSIKGMMRKAQSLAGVGFEYKKSNIHLEKIKTILAEIISNS
jgi:tetratricopeptide (TPR) repeat protein